MPKMLPHVLQQTSKKLLLFPLGGMMYGILIGLAVGGVCAGLLFFFTSLNPILAVAAASFGAVIGAFIGGALGLVVFFILGVALTPRPDFRESFGHAVSGAWRASAVCALVGLCSVPIIASPLQTAFSWQLGDSSPTIGSVIGFCLGFSAGAFAGAFSREPNWLTLPLPVVKEQLLGAIRKFKPGAFR